jgi:hypothetical protein
MPKISTRKRTMPVDTVKKRTIPVDVIAPTIPEDEFDEEEELQKAAHAGLPWQAFAMVPDKDNPLSWKLPHHTRQVYRAIKGKIGYEHTVDWENMPLMVQYLSMNGLEGQRVQGEPSDLLAAAKHLASHYSKAGKPLPDALAVIV